MGPLYVFYCRVNSTYSDKDTLSLLDLKLAGDLGQ